MTIVSGFKGDGQLVARPHAEQNGNSRIRMKQNSRQDSRQDSTQKFNARFNANDYAKKSKTALKKSSVPSCSSLSSGVSLISNGWSRWDHESPPLVPMSRSRCACNAGQWKTMWSPSCVSCEHAGQRGSSAFPILCSHKYSKKRLPNTTNI